MKLIVGLGNPGAEYESTRHNVGFMVLDRLLEKFRFAERLHEKDAFVRKGRVAGQPVVIAYPQTYMNRSGRSVASLARSYTDSLEDLVVVYDDVDLEVGRVRIRTGGSAGTHNGMRSIVEEIGSEAFPRVRLGVRGEGCEESRLADYVLDEFDVDEKELVEEMIEDAVEGLILIARGDIRRAMNELNRKRREEAIE